MDLNIVNQEVNSVGTYIKYTLPPITEIIYDENNYWGEVKDSEINSSEWTIHLSNKLNECPQKFQKSIIWHEAVHVYDILLFRNTKQSSYGGVMCTYSESYAQSIQLRYLLGLKPTQISSNSSTALIYAKGKTDIGTVTSSFINQSIHALNKLQSTHSPKDFKSFITYFCYLCGYLMLKPRKDANTLAKSVISLYPKYNNELIKLYTAILTKDLKMCELIYHSLAYDIVSDVLGQI